MILYNILLINIKKTESIFAISTTEDLFILLGFEKTPQWLKKQEKMDLNLGLMVQEENILQKIKNKEIAITQLTLRNSEAEISNIFDNLPKYITDKYTCFLTNKIFVDVNPLNVNKAKVIIYLKEKYNLDYSNIFTFGDSGNDIEMLKLTKNSFAMANATNTAKIAANNVIGDHNSNAIYDVIIKNC